MGSKLELKFMDEETEAGRGREKCQVSGHGMGSPFSLRVDSSGSSMAIGPVLPELDRICMFDPRLDSSLDRGVGSGKGIKQIFRIADPVYQEAILAALIFKDFPNIKRWAGIHCDYEYGYVAWALFQRYSQKVSPGCGICLYRLGPFRDDGLLLPTSLP